MARVQKSVLLWYSAEQMFRLVTDVRAYPQFLPWCAQAIVHAEDAHGMHATLAIDYRGVKQQFTTRNTHVENERVTMELEQGPFSQLHGQWRFLALAADACKVEFDLSYRFASGLLERVVGPVFDGITSNFVDAFVQRAEVLYGAA
jgi:ribosome-associated toxin RatA of RatAB toxin-antitoxin module